MLPDYIPTLEIDYDLKDQFPNSLNSNHFQLNINDKVREFDSFNSRIRKYSKTLPGISGVQGMSKVNAAGPKTANVLH